LRLRDFPQQICQNSRIVVDTLVARNERAGRFDRHLQHLGGEGRLQRHDVLEVAEGDRKLAHGHAVAEDLQVARRATGPTCLRVAPSQIVETIISVNGEKRLGPMRWGFVPPAAKEPKLAPINARGRDFAHVTDVPGRLSPPSLAPDHPV